MTFFFFLHVVWNVVMVIGARQDTKGQALVMFITYFMNVKSDLTDANGI